MKSVLIFFFICLPAFAQTVVTGQEAQDLFNNLKGYEYSASAISSGIEVKLTVRHNSSVSCEKEETFYSKEVQVNYTCTIN